VIGSIRRECLDHLVVISERRLMRILSAHVDYYNGTRTHLSRVRNTPELRSVQPPSPGGSVAEVCHALVGSITKTSGAQYKAQGLLRFYHRTA
jgi:hypothetical protein